MCLKFITALTTQVRPNSKRFCIDGHVKGSAGTVAVTSSEQRQDNEYKTRGGPENLVLFLRSFGIF